MNKTLHLIVHKELLKIFNKGGKNNETLQRISEVEGKSSDVKSIPWITGNLSCIYDLDKAPGLGNNYDLVVLYGSCRGECLRITANFLIKENIPVAYDIEGTA